METAPSTSPCQIVCSDNVSVLLGMETAPFQSAVNYEIGNQACCSAIGDLNGDGDPGRGCGKSGRQQCLGFVG